MRKMSFEKENEVKRKKELVRGVGNARSICIYISNCDAIDNTKCEKRERKE